MVTQWVADKIDEVPPRHRPGINGLVWGEHPEVPFRWALWQALSFDAAGLIGPNARVVQITFAKPANLEELRMTRLRRALDEKVPKLLEAAGNSRRSILVIEDRDAVFSAPAFVSRALELASDGRPLPDVIYLLDTGRGNPHMLAVYDAGVWAHAGDAWYDWKAITIGGRLVVDLWGGTATFDGPEDDLNAVELERGVGVEVVGTLVRTECGARRCIGDHPVVGERVQGA